MPLSRTCTLTQPSSTLLGLDEDAWDGAGLDVLEGVADQVVEHLAQEHPVGPDVDQLTGDDLAATLGTVAGGRDVLDQVASARSARSCRDWSRATAWARRSAMKPRIWSTPARMCCTIGAAAEGVGLVAVGESSSRASAQPSITLSGLFRSCATVPAKRPATRGAGSGRGGVAEHDHHALGGADSACGHREGRALEPRGRRRTRRCGGSPRRSIDSPGQGPHAAGSRAPPEAVRRGGRPVPGVLVGALDPVERLGLAGAERGEQRLVGVQDAAALLDDRDPVVEVRHHHVELLGPDGQDWPRTPASLARVSRTWRRLRLIVMPSTISTTTKTWAIAARLDRVVDGGDRAEVGDREPDAGRAGEQAGGAVTTGLKRTATHTMVSVSMNVVGASGFSTNPKLEDRAPWRRSTAERLTEVGTGWAG